MARYLHLVTDIATLTNIDLNFSRPEYMSVHSGATAQAIQLETCDVHITHCS
jgi:hypothetical protein